MMSSDILRIRAALSSDARLLWEWRNEPLVRANSFTSEFVPWEVHQDWYARKLSSSETRIYILEDDQGNALGQIRFERQDRKVARIHLSVIPAVRGRGYGRALLSRTLPLARAELNVEQFEALVKVGNDPSLRLFQSAGFIIQDELTIAGFQAVSLIYPCSSSGIHGASPMDPR